MLSIVLLVFLGLSGVGLLLDKTLLGMVESTRRITTALAWHDERSADLSALRIAIGDQTRRVEKGGIVPESRWQALEHESASRLADSGPHEGALPTDVQHAMVDMRREEQRFAEAAAILMRGARRNDGAIKRDMPRFVAALHDLEQQRFQVHQQLVKQLNWRSRLVEALARRALVQMAVAVAIFVMLVTLLFVWLRMRIMRPLMTIVTAVRAMNAGEAPTPLPLIGRRDELGELAVALDALGHAAEERERIQRQVEYLAHHDSLTGLANRLVFADALSMALRAGHRIALLAIDLDGFKGVNDTLGHATGDMLLKRAGALLVQAAGEQDVVARIGGDEFAIIHHLPPGESDAGALVDRLFAIVAADPGSPAIRFSVGIALSPRHGLEGDELQACADIALYRAKADGRHRARHYDAAMDEERRQRHWLAHELCDSALRGELRLAFQPIADCKTRRIIGQEALARWTHPVLGPIKPDVFIAIAEENGLILEIGEHLLIEALMIARCWPPDWMLAINLSPVQLRDPGLATDMLKLIRAHGMDPRRIEVEVTEGVLIEQRETATANLLRLREAGVRIVMDDFGTGYSSLSSLQQFPFDKIKIDRSFVSAMDEKGPALSIVRASIGLGRSLNIPIVAEGVETEAQHATLLELGCDQVQGYLIGRPTLQQARAA
ncbi:EAL domain-containing protein [Sphingomonas sp.]|uniref:putative bifunctional diguanylate cyclase/phosphodiesterase n=1 Tax=Sphingomonas sp. TaxID=28214 RepID=UPI0031D3E2F3